MGILDELKQQAEKQQAGSAQEAPPPGADEYYRAHVQARMLSAFNFLSELVSQLNAINLDTRVDYPFRPDGKPVTLLQQGYKVYSDHITEPRQITLAFHCALVNPVSYEINDRAAVLQQSAVLDRFHFKYEKQEQKDARQIVTGARFKLIGPLPIKTVLQFDESKQIIKLLMANFAGPGTSQYNLKPEKLDEVFLDDFAKYILRKKETLFQEEVPDELKARLRERLQEEQRLREAELQAAEQARKDEESLRKQNSTKEQLKKAVSEQKEQLKKVVGEQLEQKKEKLKDIFSKVKQQANAVLTPAPKQAAQARPAIQTATTPPVRSAQRPDVTPVAAQQARQKVTAEQASPVPVAPQARANSMPAQTIEVSSVTKKPASQSDVRPPAQNAQQSGVTAPRQAPSAPPRQKPPPPKVYKAPAGNPFLKPEPPVEEIIAEEKRRQAEMLDKSATVAKDATATAHPSGNPFLKPEPPVEEVLAEERRQQSAMQDKSDIAATAATAASSGNEVTTKVQAERLVERLGKPSNTPQPPEQTLPAAPGQAQSEIQQTPETVAQAEADLSPRLELMPDAHEETPPAAPDQAQSEIQETTETVVQAQTASSPRLELMPDAPEQTLPAAPGQAQSEIQETTETVVQAETASSPRLELAAEEYSAAPPVNTTIKPDPLEQTPPAAPSQTQSNIQYEPQDVAETEAESLPQLEVTPEALEAHLARIIEREQAGSGQQNPMQTPVSSTSKSPEAREQTSPLTLQSEPLDIDLSDFVVPPDDEAGKDKA